MSPFRLFAVLLCCCLYPHVQADETLTLYYLERPPFIGANKQGEVDGLTVEPVERALKRAGIAYSWVKMPWNRQLALLQANQGRACGTLFYKTAERERWGRYSEPIYHDSALVFVTRTNYALKEKTFNAVMRNKAHRFLVKERVASVPELSDALREAKSHTIYTYYETSEMLDMLRRGLGDVVVVPGEEARYLFEQQGGAISGLRLWSLADMPKGQSRHLLCTLSVPPEWMEQINVHIRATSRR